MNDGPTRIVSATVDRDRLTFTHNHTHETRRSPENGIAS